MCETRRIAEEVGCRCPRTLAQYLNEMKEDQPITSWVMIGLGKGLYYAGWGLAWATGWLMGHLWQGTLDAWALFWWVMASLWIWVTTPKEAELPIPALVPASDFGVSAQSNAKPAAPQYTWDFTSMTIKNKARNGKVV